MEKRKQFLFFGILIVGFIGLVAASPTIYAIVEPHITIDMDPGQTTKPFVINDDTGSEVFSIDVDGTITPSGTTTGTGGITSFEFFQKSPMTFFADRDDPFVFAKWRLTWNLDAGTPKITLTKNMDTVSGEIRGLGVDGSGAAATGDLGVSRFQVTTQGSGYPPNTQFLATISGGGGSGAIGNVFVLSDGSINFIDVVNRGSGYTSPPTVTIDSPPSGTTATATARMGIVDLNISSGGSGYNSAQVVTFTGGGGSGASGDTVISGPGGSVIGYADFPREGNDYTSPPTAVFGDASGRAEAAIYVIEGTRVDEWSSIGSSGETFENVDDQFFPDSIAFDKTVQTMDIAFVGFSTETKVGELRNTYWQFQMRIPDFVTISRVS